jgi:hypothetical protein
MALLASNVDIDLSQLSEQEKAAILEVVRRDKELRQNELDYIEYVFFSQSRIELRSEASHLWSPIFFLIWLEW